MYILLTEWQLNHCFFKLKFNSVFAATSTKNEVVKLTLQRIGFKRVGVLRESFWFTDLFIFFKDHYLGRLD